MPNDWPRGRLRAPPRNEDQPLTPRRGWTQARLAEEFGIDARSLQQIEAGRTAPLRRLREIADVFGVSCGSLLDDASTPKRRPNLSSAARDQAKDDDAGATLLRAWSRVPRSRRRLALTILRLLATETGE